jgi:restriction system protein
MDSSPSVPSVPKFYWPTLQALKKIGGSGNRQEVIDTVISLMGLTEEQQAVLHNDGPKTKAHYRTEWALSHLKGMELTTNSSRGVWTLTASGREVEENRLPGIASRWNARKRAEHKAKKATPSSDDDSAAASDPDDGNDWRDELKAVLIGLSADAFERLTQRLLREAGFINTRVLGRTGDGGIDGVGTYRISLISFPVFFQCKRYTGSVSSSAVRDFRGAMAGRGDKGLLVTTGTFTTDAQRESTRDGATPVDLVDGDRLCDLLKEYDLGLTTELVHTERVTVNRQFFNSI